jgi:hypothetical protein
MANSKISDLSALTTPATGDLLPIVDISDTSQGASGSTKKITYANLTTEFAPKASPTFTGTVTVPVGLTGLLRADTGVVSVDSTTVVNASTTAKGISEQATAAQVQAGTETGETSAPLFINPSNIGDILTGAVTIETTTGTTHALTTVAGQRVIVWAKGDLTKTSAGAVAVTVTLKYNTVVKDTAIPYNENVTTNRSFALMYTETPGAATQNITVETDGGSIANVKIIVLKIKA